MKINKEIRRLSREMLRASFTDGQLDPGRIASLERFLDYAIGHERVWITRRIDIARHWIAAHPLAG